MSTAQPDRREADRREADRHDALARTVGDLEEQTVRLVRQEVRAAKDELSAKARAWVPALGLAGVASVGGVFAGAFMFRALARGLERIAGRGLASVLGMAASGALAGVAGREALRRIRHAPAPVPTDTIDATRAGLG